MPILDLPDGEQIEAPDNPTPKDLENIRRVYEIANKRAKKPLSEEAYAKRVATDVASPLGDSDIRKDQTKQVNGEVGKRDLADDFARAARRGFARPAMGVLKTARDDLGLPVKEAEQGLESWIGDQGNLPPLTRALGGATGGVAGMLGLGTPGLLATTLGGAMDTRADLKRGGATELAASTVGAIDAASTFAGGKLLRSTKPFTAAGQNVGQEYATGKLQNFILERSKTPQLAEQFDPTFEQLLASGLTGGLVPAVRNQVIASKVRDSVPVEVKNSPALKSAEEQVKAAKNAKEGLGPDGDSVLLREPVLTKQQQDVAKKLSVGEEVPDATKEIDAQRINAPQFGSEKPRLGQDQEAFGAAQDARIQADSLIKQGRQEPVDPVPNTHEDLVKFMQGLPPEDTARLLKATPEEIKEYFANLNKIPDEASPANKEDLEAKLLNTIPNAGERYQKAYSEATTVHEAIDSIRGMVAANPLGSDTNKQAVRILDSVQAVFKNMEAQGVKINFNVKDAKDTDAAGWVNPSKAKQLDIVLNSKAQGDRGTETFIHELVHAAVIPLSQRVAYAIQSKDLNFLANNKLLVQGHKDLQELYKAFKDQKGPVFNREVGEVGNKRVEQYFPVVKDMQEFIAYGMTNGRVINWMKSLSIKGSNGLMAFVKAVGKTIGIKETDVNAHTQLWHIFDRMTTEGAKVDFTYNGKSPQLKFLDGVYEARNEKPKKLIRPSTWELVDEKPKTGSVISRIPGLEEAASPTFENLPHLMKGAVDIDFSRVRELFRPGFRYEAWTTKHPLVQTAQGEVTKAKARANEFLRKYVTGDRKGEATFGQIFPKLSVKEQIEVNQIRLMGDKNQVRIDPDKVEGLSELQRAWLKSAYTALDARWDNGNKQREAAGLPKIPYRQGYSPSILDADFASVGVDKDGLVVAVAGDNSKWAYKKAEAWLKGQEGVVEVVMIKDGTSSNNYRQNDVLTGLIKLMKILPDEDLSNQKVRELKSQVELMTNDQLFGMHLHRKPKKGVQGFTGDRPWLTPEQNAKEYNRSLINYFSKAVTADELHVPFKKLGEAFDAYRDEHPNAVKATENWMKQVAGAGASDFGRALNGTIYGAFRMAGVGPSQLRQNTGLLADMATQHVLGFFNVRSTLANMAQTLTGGGPFAMWTAERLGMGPVEATSAWTTGLAKGAFMLGEFFAPGQKVKVPLSDFDRGAFDYAEKMGILNFSEIERLHEETQNKWKQKYDAVAEWNMKAGEITTRPLVFMSMVNLIKNSKIGNEVPDSVIYDHAYNITQFAMADYSPEQRPMLYSELGLTGQLLGKFATYKHNFVGQEVRLGKDALKNPMPFVALNGMLFALSGALGMPFAEDILDLIKMMGGKNYKEEMLKNMDTVALYGILSEKLGIQMQSKFSAGNMFPDSPFQSFPAANILTKALQTVVDAADKIGDGTLSTQDVKNVARAFTPSSMQGEFDRQFNRGENNELIGKDSGVKANRTDEEWDAAKFFGWQGQTTQEALRNATDFESSDTNIRNAKRIKSTIENITRLMNQGELTPKVYEAQLQKYLKAGGDPEELAQTIVKKVSLLKQPEWYRRLKKNEDGVEATPANVRSLDNPYR